MYTPEQLNDDAARADDIGTMADGDQLRAHAANIEECEKMRHVLCLVAAHLAILYPRGIEDGDFLCLTVDEILKGEPK